MKALKINDINNNVVQEFVEEEILQQYIRDDKDEHIILKIFNSILNSITDENQNIQNRSIDRTFNELINEIKNKPEFDITKDIINKVSTNERLIRPLLDIVSENNIPKKEIKVLEISL